MGLGLITASVFIDTTQPFLDSKLDQNSVSAVAQHTAQNPNHSIAQLQLQRYVVLCVGIGLSLISLLTLFRMTAGLRTQLAQSQNKLSSMVSSLADAAVLINADLKIVDKGDSKVAALFAADEREKSLLKILSPYLEHKKIGSVKKYLKCVLAGEWEESPDNKNPLAEIEISGIGESGEPFRRYIKATCACITPKGAKSPLALLVFADTTNATALSRELDAQKRSYSEQSKVLLSMLHLDAKNLVACGHRVGQLLEDIRTLRSTNIDRRRDRKHWVSDVRRMALQVTTDTRQFGLSSIERAWEQFIGSLESKYLVEELGDQEFVHIKHELNSLVPELKLVHSVAPILLSARVKDSDNEEVVHDLRSGFIDRVSYQLEDAYASFNESYTVQHVLAESHLEARQAAKQKSREPIQAVLKSVVENRCKEQGKNAQLVCSGFEALPSKYPHIQVLENISSALVANSVDHGVEIAAVRIAARKSRVAQIDATLRVSSTGRGIELAIRDDGMGLDFAAIYDRAVVAGLLTNEHPRDDRTSLLQCLFEPTYTGTEVAPETNDNSKMLNLAAVRLAIKSVGGKVSVRSVDGQYCQFRVLFPY